MRASKGPAVLANSATTVQNAGIIISLNSTAIDLTAGASGVGSVVSNSGSITAEGGAAILFGPGDNTLILAGTSIIKGIVDAGAHSASGSNSLILGGASSGSFDVSSLGSTAQYRGFDTLRMNDSGVWTLTGANSANQTWLVSGGGVSMAGQLSGSLIAASQATGIDIEVLSGGAIHASSGSAVLVNDASRVANEGSISSSADDMETVAANGAGTSVVNAGSISAEGARGVGVAIHTPTGAASLTNEQGASITSAAGIAVQAGSNVSVVNAGSIEWDRGCNRCASGCDKPNEQMRRIDQGCGGRYCTGRFIRFNRQRGIHCSGRRERHGGCNQRASGCREPDERTGRIDQERLGHCRAGRFERFDCQRRNANR